LLARQALPGMLTPQDLAGIFLFLASADAAALTGQAMVVSNGEVMS
jgi:NAD(P)-dependent dehydrogenase (short-subunit alcohol dehydrogenase family)